MKTLDRYFLREFLIPLCYCIAAFVLVYIIYDLSAHLDDYVEYGVPFSQLGRYYLVQMPLVMVNLIPLSILLAIVYCLGNLSRHNEITAMRAAGISIWRMVCPFFILGIFFTGVIFYLNENFAPEAYARSERLIEEYSREAEKEERGGEPELSPVAFYNPLAERTWVGQWDPETQTIYEVSVRTLRNRQVTEKYTARRASFLDGEWWFFDGSIQLYDERGRVRGEEERFAKRRFPFNEKPDDFLSSQKDSISMSSLELSRNMAFYPPGSDIYIRKLVDLRYKLAFPFVGVTIVLIAVPLSIRSPRGGAAGSAGLSIGICILYYAFVMVTLSLGRGGVLPPWLASWVPNILFGGVGTAMLWKIR